jgi:hypothetical protein
MSNTWGTKQRSACAELRAQATLGSDGVRGSDAAAPDPMAAALPVGSGPRENGMTDTAPNPFNPAALRLNPRFGATLFVRPVLTRVPVRKPTKQEWFRVHPDAAYRMDMGLITIDEDGSTYAVTEALQPELSDLMVPMTIYTAVTRAGTVLLWPVRLPGEDGRNHDAWTSAHDAAEWSTKEWSRIQWSPPDSSYKLTVAKGITDDPLWPELTFYELLGIAFRGKIIDKPDHLVIRKLRGEA